MYRDEVLLRIFDATPEGDYWLWNWQASARTVLDELKQGSRVAWSFFLRCLLTKRRKRLSLRKHDDILTASAWHQASSNLGRYLKNSKWATLVSDQSLGSIGIWQWRSQRRKYKSVPTQITRLRKSGLKLSTDLQASEERSRVCLTRCSYHRPISASTIFMSWLGLI
jgi:hypothetical protein